MHECIIDFQKIVDKNCVKGLSFQLVQIKMSVYDFLNLYFKCHVVIEKKMFTVIATDKQCILQHHIVQTLKACKLPAVL